MAYYESDKRAIKHSATVNVGAIPADGDATATVTLPAGMNVEVGDIAIVNAPSLEAGLTASAWVSAANTVTLQVSNSGAGTRAQGTLTMDTNPTDGDTMTVDSKVYTFQDTLTDADGNVKIGATLADTKASLVAAFDLSGTAGTDYAASMTAHPTVNIAAFVVNDAVLTAKAGGTAGNSLATTETFTAVTNVFDAATLGTTTAGTDGSPADPGSQTYYFAIIR